MICAEIIFAQIKERLMWTYEHSAEADIPVERIWELWADVTGWPSWNSDIEQIAIDGPFESGSTITMTPIGQEPVQLQIAEARENESFIDEARFGGMVIRTIHRVEQVAPACARISYRTEINGDGAEDAGQQITADFPETVAALIDRAAG